MTDRYRDIKQKLCKYAEQDKDIKAVIAIGSSTRSEVPADEFSDLDLMKLMSIAMKPLATPPFPLEKIEEMTRAMGGDGELKW